MYKKMITTICAMATLGVTMCANAEILVILPETGPMASASESIKRGFASANQQANNKYEIRYVNVDKTSLTNILKTQVSKKTELIVGPLDKKDVEQLIKLQPKIPALALNQIHAYGKNIYQFALSKEEDALALTKRMQWDGIGEVIVLRDANTRAQTQSFYDAMLQLWGDKMQLKDTLPKSLKANQGVLLIGDNAWISKQALPKKKIYTLPYAINEKVQLPEGLVYCDTPALYVNQWQDVIKAYQQKPVDLPFQRLIAFGGDAWQLADRLVKHKPDQVIEFQGRTGQLRVVGSILERQPQCFMSLASGQQLPL